MNKDFERVELGPREEEEKGIKTLSALSSSKGKEAREAMEDERFDLVRSLLRRGELSKRTAPAKQHCIWKQLHCKHGREA